MPRIIWAAASPPVISTLSRGIFPISIHAVGLSLGSAHGLDDAHLERIAELVRRIEPIFVSDHLSWGVAEAGYLADLLPLPLTEEALAVVCRNVDRAQQRLRRRIPIENPSTYRQFAHSTLSEPEFLSEVAARTGCGLLCDVNNIYVSACNHGWDMQAYLAALPEDAVAEIQLAGHSIRPIAGGRTIRIDDHGSPTAAAVWTLYQAALRLFGDVPTLIEWDTDVPAFEVPIAEAEKARRRPNAYRQRADNENCRERIA